MTALCAECLRDWKRRRARRRNEKGSHFSVRAMEKPTYRTDRRVGASECRCLVRALGEERNEHHKIGQCEEPVVGIAGGLGGASDETEVASFGELANVLDADAGQAGNFRIGEYFLAGFDGNHGHSPELLTILIVTLALKPLLHAVCFLSLPTMLKEA